MQSSSIQICSLIYSLSFNKMYNCTFLLFNTNPPLVNNDESLSGKLNIKAV